MSELDIYESLSDKTVAELVEIIIQLSKLITELEMEVQICRENKK
nr:MAG TPA: A-type inclusion protein repeat protein [Caudoviricetes sp.]